MLTAAEQPEETVAHLIELANPAGDTAAGLAHDATHPVDLVQGLVGSGWGSRLAGWEDRNGWDVTGTRRAADGVTGTSHQRPRNAPRDQAGTPGPAGR